MPELGESVTEGTVTRWLKQVGDTVELDEPLLEVSTDKVDTEIPSPVAGTLLSITVDEDETVQVGAELAVVGDPDQGGGSSDAPAQDEAEEPAPAQEAPKEKAPKQAAPKQEARTQRGGPEAEGPRAGDGRRAGAGRGLPTTRPPRAVTTVKHVPRT